MLADVQQTTRQLSECPRLSTAQIRRHGTRPSPRTNPCVTRGAHANLPFFRCCRTAGHPSCPLCSGVRRRHGAEPEDRRRQDRIRQETLPPPNEPSTLEAFFTHNVLLHRNVTDFLARAVVARREEDPGRRHAGYAARRHRRVHRRRGGAPRRRPERLRGGCRRRRGAQGQLHLHPGDRQGGRGRQADAEDFGVQRRRVRLLLQRRLVQQGRERARSWNGSSSRTASSRSSTTTTSRRLANAPCTSCGPSSSKATTTSTSPSPPPRRRSRPSASASTRSNSMPSTVPRSRPSSRRPRRAAYFPRRGCRPSRCGSSISLRCPRAARSPPATSDF